MLADGEAQAHPSPWFVVISFSSEEEQRAREAEERRVAGKLVTAGDVQVNVALDDVHVSEEDTLPAWLLDPAQCVAGKCVARVWRTNRGLHVLGQCRNRCKGQGEFCGRHGKPEERLLGIWDPVNHHSSLTRECGDKYGLAVREARLREEGPADSFRSRIGWDATITVRIQALNRRSIERSKH